MLDGIFIPVLISFKILIPLGYRSDTLFKETKLFYKMPVIVVKTSNLTQVYYYNLLSDV